MYCIKCGEKLEDDASFCGSCGTPTTTTDNPRKVYVTERNVGLTVLLGLIWMGAGHLYVGQIQKGIMIMLGAIVLVVIAWFALLFVAILGIVLALLVAAGYIWSIFDAYNLAKEYNSELLRTGNPPW